MLVGGYADERQWSGQRWPNQRARSCCCQAVTCCAEFCALDCARLEGGQPLDTSCACPKAVLCQPAPLSNPYPRPLALSNQPQPCSSISSPNNHSRRLAASSITHPIRTPCACPLPHSGVILPMCAWHPCPSDPLRYRYRYSLQQPDTHPMCLASSSSSATSCATMPPMMSSEKRASSSCVASE